MSRSATEARPDVPCMARWGNGLRIAGGLTIAYLAMLAAGFVMLWLPGATIAGNEMSVHRAVFTAVNAGTLTGFQQAVPVEDYAAAGKATVIILTLGGTLFAFIVGGLGLARAAKLAYTDGQIVTATLFTTVFAISCGTAMLLEPSRGLMASAVQALSALGNSGLWLGKLPGITDWRIHAAVLPLAFVGGLSIPVLMELADAIFKRQKLSAHTRRVLTLLALVYLLGVLLLSPWSSPRPGVSMASGSALSLNSRSAGFALTPVGSMARASQWLLVVMMIVGAAPGGTAGGMKVTALYHGFGGTRRMLAGQLPGRLCGIAMVWIAGYLLLVFATLMGLLIALPELPSDRLLFLAASAVGNVGLSHDPVTVTGSPVYVLSAAMLFGRLAPLGVLWWCASLSTRDEIAVG